MDTQPKRAVLRSFAGLGAAMLALAAAVAAGQSSGPAGAPAAAPATAPAVDQHGPTIKETYANCFLIGMAGDLPGNYSDVEIGLIKENFGVVTPENCMKPAPVHPEENTWRFERPDALVKWCEENHMVVHGHTLVWHAQTANWFFEGGDKETITRRLQGAHHHAGRPLQGEGP